MGQLMQDEQVRAAVEAAVRAAVMDRAAVIDPEELVRAATESIMTVARDHASDEYSRGSSDGRFTESFYGMSGDF
jgi:hypothetical protein